MPAPKDNGSGFLCIIVLGEPVLNVLVGIHTDVRILAQRSRQQRKLPHYEDKSGKYFFSV